MLRTLPKKSVTSTYREREKVTLLKYIKYEEEEERERERERETLFSGRLNRSVLT